MKKQYLTFSKLKTFYAYIDSSDIEKLSCNYQFKRILFALTADLIYQVLPVYGQKYGFKTVVYNFGITTNRAVISDYAFQNADLGIDWGKGNFSMNKNTSDYGRLVSVGFWGKEYYTNSVKNKNKIYNLLPGLNRNLPTIIFFDVPYFPHHNSISAEVFQQFYEMLLECANWGDVNVVLRVKNLFDPKRFPKHLQNTFENISKHINDSPILISDRKSALDPLDCIAISDINISIELMTPSTLALLCNKVGLFYNVINNELITHCLFPKYMNTIIFDDTKKLMIKIKQCLNQKLTADTLIDMKDLEPYNALPEGSATERFCRELLGMQKK